MKVNKIMVHENDIDTTNENKFIQTQTEKLIKTNYEMKIWEKKSKIQNKGKQLTRRKTQSTQRYNSQIKQSRD